MRAINSSSTRHRWFEALWAVFSAGNLAVIVIYQNFETVPFHFIWISFTLLYGFRVWPMRPTLLVLAVVMVSTAATITLDITRGTERWEELTEVPLMASMFLAMVWHAQRRLAATRVTERVGQENERLLATQRRFLQDASHHLRTPITIAIGHAELLATGQGEEADLRVIVEELGRLRQLGDRLLDIAAAQDPDFLRPEPVPMAPFIRDLLARWSPTVPRRWELGRVDDVVAWADRERLTLAVGALLENAVQATRPGDGIRLSLLGGETARLRITDEGSGMSAEQLAHVFERFQTGGRSLHRTGLGLTLVRAIAHAHGGDITVRSMPGLGSTFILELPAIPAPDPAPPALVREVR